VLKGGRSAEREVSLNTGTQVAEALVAAEHDVVQVDAADTDFIEQIREAGPDVVFICLHGRYGEDGTVQGLLDLLDIPYVGSGVLASALAMDKVMSKHFFEHAGLPTPDYTVIRRGDSVDTLAITAELGNETVVKPANEGSAIGVTISHEPESLGPAIEEAFIHDETVLVERFVPGVEVTVGVLGNEDPQPLPTLEIVPEHEFYDYESKYIPGMSRHIIPARVGDAANAECSRIAVDAHKVLGCRGMSRTDLIVAEDGTIQVLEVNTIPGMTTTSLLPDAARAAGIEFPELCSRLVEYALA
jgi:D-alanine-D-alanine ligase